MVIIHYTDSPDFISTYNALAVDAPHPTVWRHITYSDAQVLGDRGQLSAGLRLVLWLRCRYPDRVRNVIGHNESLSSPDHREDGQALRTQTQGDFDNRDMQIYRRLLQREGGCG